MISVKRLQKIAAGVALVVGLVMTATNIMAEGSFFKKPPAETSPAIQPSPSQESQHPPPERPEPVHRLSDVPEADGKSLGVFIAQKAGLEKISRSFLSDWFALTDCDTWLHDNKDEFAMEEHRAKAMASLGAAPAMRRVRIQFNTKLGEYTFDKHEFPLDPITKNNSFRIPVDPQCRGFYPGDSNDRFPSFFIITMTEDASWFPGLPMETQAAHTLVVQMAGNRNVVADLVVDLVDIKQNNYNNYREYPLTARPVAMFLWRDAKKAQFVGAVGQYDAGAELAQKSLSTATPPPQRPTPDQRPPNAETANSLATPSQPGQGVKINYQSEATSYVERMISYAQDGEKVISIKNEFEKLNKPKGGDNKTARKLNEEALTLIKQSKLAEAIPLLKDANKADPSDVEITNNLASVYFYFISTIDLGKAKALLVDTLLLRPDRNIAWANLGYTFAMEGNEYAATNCYINFYRFSSNKEKALQHLANGRNEQYPVLNKALTNAYQYVSNIMPMK